MIGKDDFDSAAPGFSQRSKGNLSGESVHVNDVRPLLVQDLGESPRSLYITFTIKDSHIRHLVRYGEASHGKAQVFVT
jgi:hypothetical protein